MNDDNDDNDDDDDDDNDDDNNDDKEEQVALSKQSNRTYTLHTIDIFKKNRTRCTLKQEHS